MVRKRLGKMNADRSFPVIFSSELANMDSIVQVEGELNKKTIAGTISYMPAIFGMFCASIVMRNLTGDFELT